jgi:hypothetical protein
MTPEANMAMMCSMQGCREKCGPCIHEKLMLVMGLAAMAVAAIYFLRHFA